jgi:pimeloyl-ACP methyl ester carboxylesterase
MSASETGFVAADGARLFTRKQGRGPLLLLSAGGAGDADSFDGLAAELAPHFTVVAYDRRRYARSSREDASGAVIPIATQSADALAVIAAHGSGPAFVFGSSLGAVIALDLTLRHAERVARLVAHEPPLPELRDAAPAPGTRLADFDHLPPEQALARFAGTFGVTRGATDPAAQLGVRDGSRRASAAFFLRQEAPAVGAFRLDRTALTREANRIVFGGGEEGRDFFPYACAKRAAEISGARFVAFPGNHAGYIQQPAAFADRLRDVLGIGCSG